MNLNEFMLRKKNYKRMFAVLATTLFSAVSLT
ncbi:hypothetical protein SAMN05444364_10965 [Prevotella scopos JCM 17725]|uniref:Uncharacterized protein n=1 Tax=Prevotella scopos JCM 17725 TaxID=1236518 RepID=A0AAX2F361_9BACT|nr:hypothetical protein SAMN05444364_10965 [Prevotella scopos JCM 17725]